MLPLTTPTGSYKRQNGHRSCNVAVVVVVQLTPLLLLYRSLCSTLHPRAAPITPLTRQRQAPRFQFALYELPPSDLHLLIDRSHSASLDNHIRLGEQLLARHELLQDFLRFRFLGLQRQLKNHAPRRVRSAGELVEGWIGDASRGELLEIREDL
jgi:hypothetical protein